MIYSFKIMIFYFLFGLTARVVGQWELNGLQNEMSSISEGSANPLSSTKTKNGRDFMMMEFHHLHQVLSENKLEKPLWVRHQPSEDFNVYLVVKHDFIPNISTSLEFSINRTGIMNLRHTIVLRKKKK
ncbi:hypothetical protein [Ekhidna sp.]|uniref:hypothetical protein n=1 Tax=Ekhidna sp. TaxID=2608089 RepID=UPI0032ED68A3